MIDGLYPNLEELQGLRSIGLDLTGAENGDAPHCAVLLDLGPDVAPRAVIGDNGYASKANRAMARARGIAPVTAHKNNEKDKPAFFARTLYKARARIEQKIGALKRFKRVALRCEKTPGTSAPSSVSRQDYARSNSSTPPSFMAIRPHNRSESFLIHRQTAEPPSE